MRQAVRQPDHLAHAGQGQQVLFDGLERHARIAVAPQAGVGDEQALAVDLHPAAFHGQWRCQAGDVQRLCQPPVHRAGVLVVGAGAFEGLRRVAGMPAAAPAGPAVTAPLEVDDERVVIAVGAEHRAVAHEEGRLRVLDETHLAGIQAAAGQQRAGPRLCLVVAHQHADGHMRPQGLGQVAGEGFMPGVVAQPHGGDRVEIGRESGAG